MPDAPRGVRASDRHLAAIGCAPRAAGSDAEARARGHAREALRAAGYEVTDVPFTYSDVPGRLGAPIAGAWTALTFAATAAAGARGRPGLACGVLASGVAALAAAGWWVARFGTMRVPWRRRTGVNLVATRGRRGETVDTLPGAGVGVWLVAHLDSKSQPVAMVTRVGGVIGALATSAVIGAVAGAEFATGHAVVGPRSWAVLGLVGVIAAVPVAATTVGDYSDGALDNASGVAAVLRAAEALAAGPGPEHGATDGLAGAASIGVLLTSAEELGMAGAHAWADAWERAGREPAIALNCDGVDDAGPLTVLRGRRLTQRVARALATSAALVRRIPPGLLVDAVALESAGWSAVTVSKGSWATLARVHTRRDTLTNLRGAGIDDAAALLASLARVLGAAGRG